MHTLLFLEPGHFHAALLLKSVNPRIAKEIHLYASPGPERDSFLALVESFNTREDAPTHWQVRLHDAADRTDALEQLVTDRLGRAVVIAGRNGDKLSQIERLHREGFAVIADKPWITASSSMDHLKSACTGSPLAMDIMPDRHELLSRIRRKVVATPEVFGEFALDDPLRPAIEITSVHHLYKIVNGAPLRRPGWYYDVTEQGDGLVDVQSHLTDQAQALVGASHQYDYDHEVLIDSVRLYTTPVALDLFQESTGLDTFPDNLAPWIKDDVLNYPCNGDIRYRLCGVSIRQVAEWGEREPEGGGDLHGAVIRGTRAVLEVEHGIHTDFVPQIHLSPQPGVDIAAALHDEVATWQDEFPGLGVESEDHRFRFTTPDSLHSTHESHFALELSRFLDYLDAGTWPDELQRRIFTRHSILAEASELAARRDHLLRP